MKQKIDMPEHTRKTSRFRKLVALSALGVCAAVMQADVLELKNGQILNGTYIGGTATTVRFETSIGIMVIPKEKALALTFTTAAQASTTPTTVPAVSPAKTAAPAPAQPASLTIPAGTTLVVRMMDGISSKNSAGTPFATKLEYDLRADGALALKGGSTIYGKVQSSTQARRARGRSTLDLRLTQISTPAGPVPIVSSGHQEAGEASIKKAARGAAAGAAIGAIVDGGDGAGTGAAIGATVGALRRGETVTIKPGTLLEFQLQQSVTIKVSH